METLSEYRKLLNLKKQIIEKLGEIELEIKKVKNKTRNKKSDEVELITLRDNKKRLQRALNKASKNLDKYDANSSTTNKKSEDIFYGIGIMLILFGGISSFYFTRIFGWAMIFLGIIVILIATISSKK